MHKHRLLIAVILLVMSVAFMICSQIDPATAQTLKVSYLAVVVTSVIVIRVLVARS